MTTKSSPRLRDVLRNREFRALWFAEAQSLIGDQLTIVTLAILIFNRTGSALLSAVVYALTFLPALAGGLGLSQLADRYPRRAVLVIGSVGQAVLIGLMAVPGMPLALLCVLVVLARLVNAPANAAQNALARDVFTDDTLYLRSQDLRAVTVNTAMLLGLAGGGVLVTTIGVQWALTLDATTFLLSALVILAMVRQRPAAGDANGTWFGAIKLVFGDERLRLLIWMSWLVGLAVIPEGLAAPLAKQLDVGDQAVGWLLAADPLGFVVGTFLLSHYVSAEHRRRLLGLMAGLPLVVLLGFGLEPGLVGALVLLGIAGAAGAYLVTVNATFMTWVPSEFRGGAVGLYRTGLRVAQGVGAILGGLAAEALGSATSAIVLAAAVGIVVAIPVAIGWSRTHRTRAEPQAS